MDLGITARSSSKRPAPAPQKLALVVTAESFTNGDAPPRRMASSSGQTSATPSVVSTTRRSRHGESIRHEMREYAERAETRAALELIRRSMDDARDAFVEAQRARERYHDLQSVSSRARRHARPHADTHAPDAQRMRVQEWVADQRRIWCQRPAPEVPSPSKRRAAASPVARFDDVVARYNLVINDYLVHQEVVGKRTGRSSWLDRRNRSSTSRPFKPPPPLHQRLSAARGVAAGAPGGSSNDLPSSSTPARRVSYPPRTAFSLARLWRLLPMKPALVFWQIMHGPPVVVHPPLFPLPDRSRTPPLTLFRLRRTVRRARPTRPLLRSHPRTPTCSTPRQPPLTPHRRPLSRAVVSLGIVINPKGGGCKVGN